MILESTLLEPSQLNRSVFRDDTTTNGFCSPLLNVDEWSRTLFIEFEQPDFDISRALRQHFNPSGSHRVEVLIHQLDSLFVQSVAIVNDMDTT